MGIFSKSGPRPSFNDQMRSRQHERLDLAVKSANHFHLDLDFTDDSLKNVDAVLEHVRSDLMNAGLKTPRAMMANKGIQGIAETLGFYLVACLEKNHQEGEWTDFSPPVGKVATFVIGGLHSYPITWCVNRIVNGTEDSVAAKYQVLVSKLPEAAGSKDNRSPQGAWKFHHNRINDQVSVIEVDPPAHLPAGTKDASIDFIHSEIGNSEGLKIWKELMGKSQNVHGNGVGIDFHDDEVHFVPLYDQWEPVTISRKDFDEFISALDHFLKSPKTTK